MSRIKSISGVVLIFLAGIAAGFVLTGKFIEIRVQRAIDSEPADIREMIERRLVQKLTLAPDQRKRIAPILESAQKRIEAIRAKSAPEIREIVAETHVEIRSTLTPEQAAEYDALVAGAK